MIPYRPGLLVATTIAFMMVACSVVAHGSAHQEEAFRGIIQTVEESTSADLVFLQGGLQQGFQNGMLLEVHQAGNPVAELMVVGTQRDFTAALILKLDPEVSLQSGDRVRVKTRKSSFFS